jgi:integrase
MQAPRRLARAARPLEDVLPDATAAATYRDVIVGLRQAISSGRLEAGDLVPTVTDLALVFGVARSTAQRAITALGSEGVIVRSGHRWIVAAIGSAA